MADLTQAEKDAKKAVTKAKKDFALHVGLVERQTATPVSLGDARAIAYLEGAVGLAKRLGQPKLV